MTPERVGRYEVVGRLGRGGMGEVFEGFDPQLKRRVAIKRLAANAPREHQERLHREALSVAALSHPAIAHVYEIVQHQGRDWVVMEYVEGKPLSELLQAGPMPLDQVLRVGTQVADGLAEAHRHNIIHRDIKTENVMVTPSGRARILDFGLAKWVGTRGLGSDALTQEGLVVGTARAMSPEQALGKPTDHRTDIFSLGSMLYELLAGVPAFRGETPMDTMVKVARAECQPLSEKHPATPAEVAAVVERCMATRPEDRFQSAAELAEALERLTATQGLGVPIHQSMSRRRVTAAAVGVAALVAALVGGLATRVATTPRRPAASVAVLPMEGQFAGDEGRLAAAAVADAVTTHLSRLEHIQVVTGRDVRAAVQEGLRSTEIAIQLGVTELVETSLIQERPGAPARVTLSRLQGATGRVLWSRDIEVGTDDLLRLQDRITQAVTDAYQGYSLDRAMLARTMSPAALTAYLEVEERFSEGSISRSFGEEITLLEDVLRDSPAFLEAILRLSGIYGALFQRTGNPGHREMSERLLARAQDLAPADPRVTRFHIALAQRLGRHEEAEPLARELTLSRPGDVEAWRNLGISLNRLGRPAEAEHALQRAYYLQPSWRNHYELADLYRELGEYGRARSTMEEILAQHPGNHFVRSRLGFVLYSAGDIDGAEQQYRRVAQERGDNLDLSNLGSMVLLGGNPVEAQQLFLRAVELAPHRAHYRANLAKAMLWAGDTEGARAAFAEALTNAEEQLAAGVERGRNRRTRALCLAHLGRGAEAVLEIQRALEANNFDAYTLSVAATVAALNGDRHGALAWTSKAREAGALAVQFTGPEFSFLRSDPEFKALLMDRS